MIRYLTAGESHGKGLVAIIEGMPANLSIDVDKINNNLYQRQRGYGRGERMQIEHDTVEIISGMRNGKTLGSPICFKIDNNDWENYKDIMSAKRVVKDNPITVPRPGHADFSGALKYNQKDIRNVSERASARETAIRVAVGSIAQQLLEQFNINVYSHVVQIGWVKADKEFVESQEFLDLINKSQLRCADKDAQKEMIKLIDNTKKEGNSLGGIFEVIATNMPFGLGSCMHWDRKLDAKISYALMSIPGVKGVEFGLGFDFAQNKGSDTHDEIYYNSQDNFFRKTNYSGGIEGGMSNGEPIVVRAVMKPIPTLQKPLKSVDLITKQEQQASVQRSDVCVVPAVSVIGQCVTAWEIACSFLNKVGGDSIEEVSNNYKYYLKRKKS